MRNQNYTVIIEDDGHLAILIRDYLQQNGYLAKTARRGDSSEDHIIHEKPALVVLDLVPPPGKYRLTVLQEIGQDHNQTILILKSHEGNLKKEINFIIDSEYQIKKPIDPKNILNRIHNLLGYFSESIESVPLAFTENSSESICIDNHTEKQKSKRTNIKYAGDMKFYVFTLLCVLFVVYWAFVLH